jgi:hypothetical protein
MRRNLGSELHSTSCLPMLTDAMKPTKMAGASRRSPQSRNHHSLVLLRRCPTGPERTMSAATMSVS